MKKRLLSLALGTMMVLSTLAGCGSKDGGSAAVNTKPEEQGKVLNIYCWNEEFKSRFEGYYKNVPSDVKVNWVITPNENNAYQNALDAALLKQKDAAADDKIDMFLIEADYALKYVNSDYTLDVKDVGLTDDDLKDMYQYTKDIATDSKENLRLQHGRQLRDSLLTDVLLLRMFLEQMIRIRFRKHFQHGISLIR